ncbi:MAG: DUF2195 family protein [Gammaproteobacteria bacterium]|nr:DUF2195 family protein [Gammaproteobacteria bacterium]
MAAQKNNMKKLSVLILAAVLSLSCNAEERVTIDNSLSACLIIQKGEIQAMDNLLLYKTSWELKDNIGNCGCKSAALSYSVYLVKNEKLMSLGMLSSLNKKQVTFVLSSDNGLYKDAEYKLTLSCAG